MVRKYTAHASQKAAFRQTWMVQNHSKSKTGKR